MKKVLFVAHVESHILHFHIPYLKMFHEKGYEVHVATNGSSMIPFCDVKYNLPFQKSPLKKENYIAFKEMKIILDTEVFEIIHCHTPVGGVIARLANRLSINYKNTRMIYTAHGFHFYKGAPLSNWIIYYPIERWMAKYTDILITINHEDYERAKKFRFKQNGSVEFVHGVGINEDKFKFPLNKIEREKLRQAIGLQRDDFVMIFPAELNHNKNQILLIKVMEQITKNHNNIKLLLLGKDLLSGEYKNEIKRRNLENNIKVLGYRNDVPKLIKISDIGISSCIREGLGLNLIEELYCGLPVIASSNRGHKEIVQKNTNGLLYDLNEIHVLESLILKCYNKEIVFEQDILKKSVEKFLIRNVQEEYRKIYFREG